MQVDHGHRPRPGRAMSVIRPRTNVPDAVLEPGDVARGEGAADQRPQPGLHGRVQHHDRRRQAELTDLVAEEGEPRGGGEHLGSTYGVPDVVEA